MNKRLIKTAIGEEKADIVFKNGKIIDVFCHRIVDGDVAVTDGIIVGIGKYEGLDEIDINGQYIMPSFIDSHVHIESSMLCPSEFAKIIAPKGVTTIIADPHEITNVCGEAGIAYMMESAKNVPIDIHYMMPSCVPATPFDNAGVSIDSEMTGELLEKYNFLGLGEMMNYPGVIGCVDDVLEKIQSTQIVDGHAPALSGKQLNAYVSAGILTDHECMTKEELEEKVSCGMYVQIREGTQSQNLSELIKGINPYTLRRILFCTDDRYLGDVIKNGSISNCVGKAIKLGIDPIDAIIISSLNAAQCYGLKHKGAIAPGYRADLLISKDISAQEITRVYKDGVCISQNGMALFEAEKVDSTKVTQTVHINEITKDDLALEFNPNMSIIQVFPHSLYTKEIHKQTDENLNLCAVIERHKNTGNIGKCYIDGFSLKDGAIAQTIGHDSHNITVIGDNTNDMTLAVNSLGTDGGMSVVKNGEVIAVFSLPIAGLMSDKKADIVLSEHKHILNAVKQLDMNREIEPFMMLSFLSLLVIPDIKLSDTGLFDVNKWKMID